MESTGVINFSKDLILNMTLVVTLSYLLCQTRIIHLLKKRHFTLRETLLLTVIFGALSTIALSFGVQYGTLTANMRYILGIVGGIFGGPLVGVGSFIISGIFRLLEDGGTRGFFIGIFMGLASGYLGNRPGLNVNILKSLKIALVCMCIHFLFIIVTIKPLSSALQLVADIAWVVYLLNILGVVLFVHIIQQEFKRDEQKRALASLAIMEERDRIAKDLHDGFAQTLFFLNTKNTILKRFIESGDKDKSLGELEQIKAVINECFTDIRQTIFNLRNTINPELDFSTILSNYIEQFERQHKIRTQFSSNIAGKIYFPLEKEIHLMRIVQESLNNVVKHAQANKVIISLINEDSYIKLIISDDGKGFSPSADNSARKKFGLLNMQERAWSIGADINIKSNKGVGTNIIIKIPKDFIKGEEKDGTGKGFISR